MPSAKTKDPAKEACWKSSVEVEKLKSHKEGLILIGVASRAAV